jgi:hypothetical protein
MCLHHHFHGLVFQEKEVVLKGFGSRDASEMSIKNTLIVEYH